MTEASETYHYLAIDPGEKRQGWAKFLANGDTVGFGKLNGTLDDFMDWFEGLDPQPKEVIYENYRVNPTIKHGFSKVPTVQLIGMMKRHCKKNKIPMHEQNNGILPIGLRYTGMYGIYYTPEGKKKKHVDDDHSALAHGVYYLVKHKIRKHRLDG